MCEAMVIWVSLTSSISMKVTSRHHSHFRLDQTFLLKQSLETGSTGFLLSGLATIALKVFFAMGEVR